jgi:hypothetical protein
MRMIKKKIWPIIISAIVIGLCSTIVVNNILVYKTVADAYQNPESSQSLYITVVQDLLKYKQEMDPSSMQICQGLYLEFPKKDSEQIHIKNILQQLTELTGIPAKQNDLETAQSFRDTHLYIGIHLQRIGYDYVELDIQSFGCPSGGRGYMARYRYDPGCHTWSISKMDHDWVS